MHSKGLLGLVGLLIALAFFAHARHYTFVQDDAYIFFRYAENLASGEGPVWNPGERVEGYTSPAWLALVAAIQLGLGEIEPAVHWLTLALGLGSLWLVLTLGRAITGSHEAGLLAAAIVAADRGFAMWSTSGMDTRLFGFATIAVSLLVHRLSERESDRIAERLLGGALALLSFTRPEGLLLAALALTYLGIRRPALARRPALRWGIALWIFAHAVHLAWRIGYYGRWLPNTFTVKVGRPSPAEGFQYLGDFASSYPVLAAAVVLSVLYHLTRLLRTRELTYSFYLCSLILSYCAYLVIIGGDFMEFRMLDVLVPHVAVLLTGDLWARMGAAAGPQRRVAVAIAGAALVLSSLASGLCFESRAHVVMTRSRMWEHSTRQWIAIGRWFGRVGEPHESIATTAAGAIPYFSKLPSVDMLGLNDATISALPDRDRGGGIGHRKMAPDSYLEERQVTFIVRHPRIYRSPKPESLRPGDFFVHVAGGPEPVTDDFYLQLSTATDRRALIRSLRARGVEVVEGVPAPLRRR